MSPTSETRCYAADTCVFDRRCEGFINCAEVDPRGLDLQLKVYVPDGQLHCNEDDCNCVDTDAYAIDLPGRRVTIAEIVEAVKAHLAEYRD